MRFQVNILGCGAATPTMRHMPTAQLVNVHDKLFLIDCGEGTQIQLRKYKFRFQRIDHIFISHLHGDHYLGLMGLLSSMHLLGRTKPLTLFAPEPLREILEVQFRASETRLSFEITYVNSIVSEKEKIYEDRTLEVFAFPLKHRVPCSGFLFIEKPRKPRLLKENIARFNLQVSEILRLKDRQDVVREDGETLSWKEITEDAPAPRAYAYCSDTAFSEKVVEAVQNVDLLYHEATFASAMALRAKQTFHSTAAQAAAVANKAGVRQLVIGHFSSRYINEFPLLDEAKEVFLNSHLANEGLCFDIEHSEY